MKALVPFACEKCGDVIWISSGARAVHFSCPKRGPKKAAPVYVEVTRVVP